MKDRILAVIGSVPEFPTTRVDTLLPFLVSVYHFCRYDSYGTSSSLYNDQRSATGPGPPREV